VVKAREAIGCGFKAVYYPNPAHTEKYRILFNRYSQIGSFIEEKIG